MFYNILSVSRLPMLWRSSLLTTARQWENPRISAISYAAIVTLIFFTRYVPVIKYTLKGAYILLGSKNTTAVK